MKNYSKTQNIIYIAFLVTLNCICSWITVPFAIPFTLQTFSIFFTLFFLGGIKGTITIIIYLLLGLAGVPVFSSFNAGITAFLGPTGGYLIGFLASAIIYTIFTKLFRNSLSSKIVSSVLGLILCYTIGTIWYVFVYSNTNVESITMVFVVCVFPYILPDILKMYLAYFVSKKTNDIIKRKTNIEKQ